MQWYSQFVGDWNDYYNNYRWQKLPSGDHSAIGDCRATLKVIEKMAATEIIESKPKKSLKANLLILNLR